TGTMAPPADLPIRPVTHTIPSSSTQFNPLRRHLMAGAAATVCSALFIPAAAASLGTGATPTNVWPPADASANAQKLLRWATATADHQGMPFAVIDKRAARIHVFSVRGQWLGSAPVLLG